jgi:chromosome segregation protein
MKALDEYEAEVGRVGELEEETKTLKDQRKNLIKVVDELNGKKKAGLMKVFDAINANFKEIFNVLSNGGDAELFLENPESPFEGGLIIKARPKDKKVLRLEALSGGEKSLTALALIFAIQQYEPSPFYLLDEVDMFLDAVNADYVAKMIKTNSTTAQFVQITLRKVTLEHSNHIYGITMRSTGITECVGKVSISEVGSEGKLGSRKQPDGKPAKEAKKSRARATRKKKPKARGAEHDEEE